jgi:hypothetical protein
VSFDLYFGREDSTLPTIQDLRAYFQKSFELNDLKSGGTQFWYKNDATGVYCSFDFDDGDEENLDVNGFSSSGLSFNLNYIRPSFFAYEAMPLVESFCHHFNLLVEDVQEEVVHTGEAGRLIDSWRSHNERAVRGLEGFTPDDETDKIELPYLPEERATEWWRYASIREGLQESVGDDIFVPSIMILESPEKQLFSVIVWPEGISQFFPRCDYVLVQRKKKRFFRTVEEFGLVSYSDVIATVGAYISDYDTSIGPLKCVPPESQVSVLPLHLNLDLMPIDLSSHKAIESDGFHDVALS